MPHLTIRLRPTGWLARVTRTIADAFRRDDTKLRCWLRSQPQNKPRSQPPAVWTRRPEPITIANQQQEEGTRTQCDTNANAA